MHFMHPPKIVQIGWGHHVKFCVWKKSAITFDEGCTLLTTVIVVVHSTAGMRRAGGSASCHHARDRVRNRKSNPEGVSPRDLMYCSHKPECMVTTNPDSSVSISIITWHFQFHPVNVSILHLKYEYRAWSESRFACYSHCYVTWCPLTTGIVASQFPSSRDAALVKR